MKQPRSHHHPLSCPLVPSLTLRRSAEKSIATVLTPIPSLRVSSALSTLAMLALSNLRLPRTGHEKTTGLRPRVIELYTWTLMLMRQRCRLKHLNDSEQWRGALISGYTSSPFSPQGTDSDVRAGPGDHPADEPGSWTFLTRGLRRSGSPGPQGLSFEVHDIRDC